MEFLKNHYEKLILSLVLLGLAVSAALMPGKVSEAQDEANRIQEIIVPKTPKPRPELDLSTNRSALAKINRPPLCDLSLPHYVFNPVRWERKPNGSILKIKSASDIGPQAVTVAALHALNLVVEFKAVTGTDDAIRYQVSVTKETDSSPKAKSFLIRGAGDRNEFFTVKEIKGPREAPAEIVIEMLEDKRVVVLTKETAYRKVIGYAADLRYEPRNKSWPKVKRGARLQIENEPYKIIEIGEKEVVLSHDSTSSSGKRTIIPSPAFK